MLYTENPRNGDALSRLGLGCMRLPHNEKRAAQVVRAAIDNGVNYLDTAYIYPGNESMLGNILKDGYRQKVKLATKLPHYLCKNSGDMDRIFQKQLERLQTDSVDYYMFHMLGTPADWERMEGLGAVDWIQGKKAAGLIGNIGFSFHGSHEAFIRLLDRYPWDFCMIQYNYMDEHFQAGRKGLAYARDKGIPVMVMEPLRGGKLAGRLPDAASRALRAADQSLTPAQYALRWLMDQPEVFMVVSGMTEPGHLSENLSVMTLPALTPAHLQAIQTAKEELARVTRAPCTACGYCMPCPSGVDIPMCLSFYNESYGRGGPVARLNYIMRAANHEASRCVQCGACDKRCPQRLPVEKLLDEARARLERFPYRPMRFIINRFLKRTPRS